MFGIEQNPKLGYYRVGDKTFYSKPQAYIHATQTGIDPTWYFNNVEFARWDWTQEPETDIRELYRVRAQQLRDQYDYIRLECSGGADSTTAAYAFLLNGIHLDEIIFRYPKQGEKDATDDPYNLKAENTLSEFKFAAQPLLNWVKTNFPKTTVRIHDYSENMLDNADKKDESWVFDTRDWFQPGHADKYSHFHVKEHRDLADSGKKICALVGIDKPRIATVNGGWYLYFMDVQANSANPRIESYTNITSEYFYWTPDLPELLAKQSHMIKNWFDLPENRHLRYLTSLQGVSSIARRTAYENILKPIIYPDYDDTTWQTAKPTNSFYNEMDYWFHLNFKDTHLYNVWESGLDYLLKNIDIKYFDHMMGRPVGLVRNTSLLYYLGSIVDQSADNFFINRAYLDHKHQILTSVENKKLKRIIV